MAHANFSLCVLLYTFSIGTSHFLHLKIKINTNIQLHFHGNINKDITKNCEMVVCLQLACKNCDPETSSSSLHGRLSTGLVQFVCVFVFLLSNRIQSTENSSQKAQTAKNISAYHYS